MEAMEKSGFSNFKPDIDNLLLNIEKEAGNAAQNKKRKIEGNVGSENNAQIESEKEGEKEKKMDIVDEEDK